MARPSWQSHKGDLLPYLRRLIVTIVVLGLALLLWELRAVLLLAFASILVAIVLLAETRLVRRIIPLGHRGALSVAVTSTVILLGLVVWLAWPTIQDQLDNLVTRLTESVGEVEALLGVQLPESAQEIGEAITGVVNQVWSVLVTVAQALVTVVTTFVLVVFAGIFLAIDPATYERGLVLLFPKSWHETVRKAMTEAGRGLRLWLQAQILTMAIVGLLVGVGAWAIDLPSPLALGLIAALTEFVPIVGPFVGAAPAVLIAFSVDSSTLIWTLILYVAVQQLEGNLITPVMQRRVVSIPPVVLLFSFVALGLLFGVAGILVAAPLTIALYILVREFYVGELLGESAALNGGPKGAEQDATRPALTRRTGRKASADRPAATRRRVPAGEK